MMQLLEKLREMSGYCKDRITQGLTEEQISHFAKIDSNLGKAVEEAYQSHIHLRTEHNSILKKSEKEQIAQIQQEYVNFYDQYAVNPYISLGARGPWIISSTGAVIHDSGGYGMLGFGHGPQKIIDAMNDNHVMANIMTANFAQKDFVEILKKEIGHSRSAGKRDPYHKFMCLNSGSESITIATRISDLNVRQLCKDGGPHQGKKVKFLSLKGSFHGRTDRPAQFSDSCLKVYQKHLESFQGRDNLDTIEPNDSEALAAVFAQAKKSGIFYEAMFMEPVMGEGNPGLGISPEFYKLARNLCNQMGSLLVVDSIQAGLRAQGCLSIMDYPGFRELDAPDMEAYSKALNAGQYPLSVLALGKYASELYVTGIYGNTMTSNPRALAVAKAVLGQVNEDLRLNICTKGKEFLEAFATLKSEFPDLIGSIQGTGLLFCMEINPKKAKVVGEEGMEFKLRKLGLGVIHGGKNALRFTPHFEITSDEIGLVTEILREVFKTY
ncbi:MAG: aminotransferase class III-fold pyridoxal phosphate-dependent enzyme [Oligoflexales bacterium]